MSHKTNNQLNAAHFGKIFLKLEQMNKPKEVIGLVPPTSSV